MNYNQVELPKMIYDIDDKLIVKADECDIEENKRKCIHATINVNKKLTVVVIGLNPSVANKNRGDRTFTKIGRYLSQYDVKDFYLLNLYETISQNPSYIKENDVTDWEKHRQLFEDVDFILVAFGTEQVNIQAKKKVIDYLKIYRRKVLCVKDSNGNKGVHIRRIKYNTPLTYFFDNPHYPIITLCGSTRFRDEFLKAQKRLTLEGYIVISVGLFGHAGDSEVWESMDEGTVTKTKEMLDDMHKRKIDIADGIYVINVGGYIGESTRSEIEYALKCGKKVEYLVSI